MLRLFQSIFGGKTRKGDYPEKLIREAIERAVDGTDPALRGLLNYRKKLRAPVLCTIDHVVDLVETLAPPLEISASRYSTDPRLKSFFISAKHMARVINENLEQNELLSQHDPPRNKRCGLLVMQQEKQKILGTDLVGETLVRDVPLTTVSFGNHRIVDITGSEQQTRRMLKRRAYDHLLSLALERISSVCAMNEALKKRRDLLQAKLNSLNRGQWGFNFSGTTKPPDIVNLETELEHIEMELHKTGWDEDQLKASLGIVTEILSQPERSLWEEKKKLVVDQMGIQRPQPGEDSFELELQYIRNTQGRRVVVSLVWM